MAAFSKKPPTVGPTVHGPLFDPEYLIATYATYWTMDLHYLVRKNTVDDVDGAEIRWAPVEVGTFYASQVVV